MKKLIIASVAFAATVSSAFAADIAPRIYTKAPVHAQVYDWTGFYVGANVGIGVGETPTNSSFNGATFHPAAVVSPFGAIGGVQAGYNWQVRGFVFGIETDIQGADLNGDKTCLLGCANGFSYIPQQTIDWFGTTRARVGFATGPVLSYVTGGFAYGGVTQSALFTGGGTVAGPFVTSNVNTGWTLGSGVEAALGGQWTGKLEYLYLDLGSQSVGGPFLGTPALAAFETRQHIFRVGVNHRIGGNSVYAVEPTANWRGFYAGVNAGSGVGRNPSGLTNTAGFNEQFSLSPRGFLGGVQAGYNWQTGNIVVGVEADFQSASLREDRACVLICAAPVAPYAFVEQKLDTLGTVRARLGYSVGSTLFYGTGGFAHGAVRTTITENSVGPILQTVSRHWSTGWTAGGGIESPLDVFGWFGKNWTAKTEYLYTELGSDNFGINVVAPTFPQNFSTTMSVHTVRGGINYRIDTGR